MEKLKITPFVKWVGGKRQLLEKLEEKLPKKYNRYYEPFVGGGALLFDVQPDDLVINDTNKQLLNIYFQLKNNVEDVIEFLKKLDSEVSNNDYYLKKRSEFNEKIASDTFDAECAALMIWINKHCFNGLYRVNSKGLFNVPFNQKLKGASFDEYNLRNISLYLNSCNIQIREGDFERACFDVQSGDFVYFDSPYVPISKTASFTKYSKEGFDMTDHQRLAVLFRELDAKGAKLMLSNHSVDLVYELYREYNIECVDVKRLINCDSTKRTGTEVIITNY